MKSLEASENWNIRYLKDRRYETTHVGIGIDTPENLEKARLMILSCRL
jgi:3-deoxy-manno-octulosonate cytidylyltransferase (CMP-KDO synthetase)